MSKNYSEKELNSIFVDTYEAFFTSFPPYLRLEHFLGYFFHKNPSLYGFNFRDIKYFRVLEEYERKVFNNFSLIFLSYSNLFFLFFFF